ncbi:MAG: nicotinate-nucleotide--dimethylbenzimidazole phosphoribosyltransferase [Bryobacteraceae bacterium]|nr:nicotinate-nucleotide--dimethylbenzimidazole phosphoribosyltransferase [Bryobacteraceae bacterium]
MSFKQMEDCMAAIRPVDDPDLEARVRSRLHRLTKPPGSLGRLESIALRYALIRGEELPPVPRKLMVIFCADHGVAAEGVSAYPQAVTAQMAANFVAGGAAISVLCRQFGIEPLIVDAGINGPTPAGVREAKIAPGTANFVDGPAMTRDQAAQSIALGIRIAREHPGVMLGAGEMGIGNTTAAAALLSVLADLDPQASAGLGAGATPAILERKVAVIRRAIALRRPGPSDPLGALAAVGGFEIGAIAGLILGAAAARSAIVVDGFISGAGAMIARAIAPAAGDFVFYAHRSAERGHAAMLRFLQADPLLDLGMRLGEGSAAAIAMTMIEASLRLYREMATFAEAGVADAT